MSQTTPNVAQNIELCKEEIESQNLRTRRVRAVEPLIESLGWSIHVPNEDARVDTDVDIGNHNVDYVLISESNPIISINVISDLEKHSEIPDSTLFHINSDGFHYRVYVKTNNDTKSILESNIQEFRNGSQKMGQFSKIAGFDRVVSGFSKSIHTKYLDIIDDRRKIQNENENIRSDLVEVAKNYIDTVPEEDIYECTGGMMEDLSSSLEPVALADIITQIEDCEDTADDLGVDYTNRVSQEDENMTGDVESVSSMGSGFGMAGDDIVLVVKDTRKNIADRIKSDSSSGRLVSYSDRRPDYIVFYVVEDNQIEYISEVESFELIEDKDTNDFADKVFNMTLQEIRSLGDPITDSKSEIESISYCTGGQILGADTLEDIDFLD